MDINIGFASIIVSFFVAVIVANFTVSRIDERYEFSSDRPKKLNRVRALSAVISFLAAFVISLLIFSVF